MATLTKDQILEAIEQMTVLELNELVKAFEEKFDVKASAPAAVAVAAAPVEAAASDAQEEKTSFDVTITAPGQQKIQVIKEIKAITGMGLKEAKELVDNAPKEIKKGISKEEAEQIKTKLESLGATIEIK